MKFSRLAAVFAVTILSFPCIAGQHKENKAIILSIDHPDGIYAVGEKVEVYASTVANFNDSIEMSVLVNGKESGAPTPKSITTGEKSSIYSASFNEAASVIVSLSTKGSKEKIAQIGFVVNPDGFQPGFENPTDFDRFWANELKEMRKSKMKPILKPYKFSERLKEYEGKIECFAFEINMPEGRPARGFISWPAGAEKKSLPVVMHFHGAGYSISNVANSIGIATNFNAIAIDMNAHGYEDVKEIADELGKTELKDYRKRPVTDHKNFYYRLMYLRDVRALDFATTLPEWDGKRIMVQGSSQGGGQSLAVAAIDKRVTAVCATVPALTDIGGNFSNHRGGWPGYAKSMEKGNNLDNEKAVLPYYDGATFARHITSAKVWMEAGLIDSTCPAECVISAFNVLKTTDKKLYTFPYREHSTSRFDVRENKLWKTAIDKPRTEEIKEYLK